MTEIKPVGIEDIEIIRSLAHLTWPTAYLQILGQEQLDYMLEKIYSSESLKHQMVQLKHRFILLTEDGVPVGFASYSQHEDATIYHLNKIYVLTNQQRKNLGKQLLSYIISQIKKSGATALQLNVNRFNKARHFYEKQGFKIIREEDIDIGCGYFMNDYLMELNF
jgi:ribosomal protein S18 acetylase RimI-like enzyme